MILHIGKRAFLLLLLLTGFVMPLSVFAVTPVAEVVSVRGDATVLRNEGGNREGVVNGSKIFLNDQINTADNGRVKLLLKDESILKVSPGSELVLSEMVVGPGEESQATMKLLKGKLRSLVGKKLGANSRFEVHTSVAVAGVRGTDFEVLVAEQTWVRCFEGVVEVRSGDSNIKGVARLRANMYTRVGAGEAPTSPEFIAPDIYLESLAGVKIDRGDVAADEWEFDVLDDLGAELGGSSSEATSVREVPALDSLSQEIIDEQLLGGAGSPQIDIVVEQPVIGSGVPVNVTIPAP